MATMVHERGGATAAQPRGMLPAMGKPRLQRCPAGQWTVLISNFGSGYPRTFEVRLRGEAGGPVSGQYQEKRATWIFPNAPVTGALAPTLSFHRKWINAIYKVSIRPDQDVVAEVR